MNSLIRKDATFRMDNLPKIKSNAFSYVTNKGYTGSIVKRPLSNGGPFWHYAFIYGFDEQNTLWLIENNDNGVECVTWKDFISNASHFEFTYFETNSSRYKEILLRALEKSKDLYDMALNNCEHFSNYCVHGKFESFQASMASKAANALLSYLEQGMIEYLEPGDENFFDEYDALREQFKLERRPELQKIIDKHTQRKNGNT